MTAPTRRYHLAFSDECGVLYRPGELSIPELNYCRLRDGHGGKYHSTRRAPHETGYEWAMASPPNIDWSREA